MTPRTIIAQVLSVLAASTLVGRPAGAGTENLTVAGSSTIQPLAERAGQAYEKLHPGVRIDVQGGGSSVGISATRSGLADVGTVSRPLKPDEQDLTPTTIAIDGVAMIVHAENPLTAVKREQVIDIYTGAIRKWAALGGNEHEIVVINKEEGRATLEMFEEHFGLRGRFRPDMLIIGPNGQAILSVAGNPDSIAYVSIGSALMARAQGTPIKLLSLDGVEATAEAVRDGRYPLKRPLNLVTRGVPSGLARAFIDFLLSPPGQELATSEGFMPPSDARRQAKAE
jgi:phosphate transport system substrate-binding protein